MRVFIFTPTRSWGGFDVSLASIERQETEHEVMWCWGDDLWQARREVLKKRRKQSSLRKWWFFDASPKLPGYRRSLARAYNVAIDLALAARADLFISMQDYIWIPPDGVDKFAEMSKEFPDAIYTGLTSISNSPFPEAIVNPMGEVTIFSEEFRERPDTDNDGYKWEDSRRTDNYRGMTGYVNVPNVEWETNYAAIPRKVLDKGVRFDETYDRDVAYENQWFAATAIREGFSCMLDLANEAISLPHKAYFPHVEAEEVNHLNREMHDERMMETFGTTAVWG